MRLNCGSDSPAGLSRWTCLPAAMHASAVSSKSRTRVSTSTACRPGVFEQLLPGHPLQASVGGLRLGLLAQLGVGFDDADDLVVGAIADRRPTCCVRMADADLPDLDSRTSTSWWAPRRLVRGPEDRHRLRQRGRLQGRARGSVGAGRRSHQDRRRAGWAQHQPGSRLDRAGCARPQGARDARRRRHRPRRRRRPHDHRRREGPRRRRRPGLGRDRGELAGRRTPRQTRHRRDRHVEFRPRAQARRAVVSRSSAPPSAIAM